MNQEKIDDENAAFWNEMCGSTFAKQLGINDSSPASLKRFDDWYFSFYPYLFHHIPFPEMRDKDVLEVGLGYGTVSQHIAESGVRYIGLDVAAGPVHMVNSRLRQSGLRGQAQQGSILAAPFVDASFDYVVAIGCLHHTGAMRTAIAECLRVLRPKGQMIFMVYYAYSYRRILTAAKDTLCYWSREASGYRGSVGSGVSSQRAAYDVSLEGNAAPHTDWISIRSLREYCKDFSSLAASLENVDDSACIFRLGPSRQSLLNSWLPRRFGLDLYATATK